MKKSILILIIIFWMAPFFAQSQTTDIVILNALEAGHLKAFLKENEQAKHHYDSIAILANQHLKDQPRPRKEIFYEGLLDNNPKRIDTRKSLEDVDKVVNLIYAYYGSSQARYARKVKEIVTAWAITYRPTGNPINENKFVPLFWAYYLFQDQFSDQEKRKVEDWMLSIAKEQMERQQTPNNNWEAKRLKIIGTVGCILDKEVLKDFSVKGLKKYINTAYYADGTSNDLKERDALHYHVSGLKPTIGIFVNCTPFDPAFDLFSHTSASGASIRKSVEYTLPYARGEKERKEWINTKVALDKERAAAGLAEYQPGMLFDPKDAIPMFEWASFYNPAWYTLLGQGTAESNYASTWVGLLNSPKIRR